METRNPLETWPNLFANGKFKVKVDDPDIDQAFMPMIITFAGITNLKNGTWVILPDFEDSFHIDHCTLIARPFKSMSDKEFKKLDKIRNKVFQVGSGVFPGEDLVYLLSIGVYPFDQQAFDDGTVIKAEAHHEG